MTEIVGGWGLSHAPGLTAWPQAPSTEVQDRVGRALGRIRDEIADARPDVVVAFLDDHFDNHYRRLMPTFALGVADEHWGPAEQYVEMLGVGSRRPIPSNAAVAQALLTGLLRAGFDVARMGSIDYGNNFMVPWHLVGPTAPLAVIPVFINVFSPPLPKPLRVYELGRAVREALGPEAGRVAFMATGGLSHWPPIWNERSDPDDAFLQRMQRYQTEGHHVLTDDPHLLSDLGEYEIEMARTSTRPLVNERWDRAFLDAFGRHDLEVIAALDWRSVEADAGHGANEILNWIALMGAVGPVEVDVLLYEPSVEWITGVAFASAGAEKEAVK